MASPVEEKVFRKEEGSNKLVGVRPMRSREGSGGILRLDIGKPRLSIGDFRGEIPSPQPSVDRLSVTFATEERSVSSDTSVKVNLFIPDTPPITRMEKVRFPTITDEEDSEDYSASVTAIMQRRASTRKSRKKGRRTSSPFSHEDGSHSARRRSSAFTTSSGDTAISLEESLPHEVAQDQIFENIKLHKEVLSSVKMQPWGMRRKLKLVLQAKSYIKKHEGVLQERLAQSRTTKDLLARFNILMTQKLQHYRREIANISNWLIPWESRIKEIESHFGSVVASYFTFLRWLFWVNLIISIVLVAFVIVPEVLTNGNPKDDRKNVIKGDERNSTNLFTLYDFEGVLRYSPLFYGYYTNEKGILQGYRLPFAYFMTGLAVYVYSFVATLRKMAENSRMSKLSEKDDECVFSWKLFTGWDYMIGNAETAHNRIASIILGFKEALLEEAEKKRQPRNWKVISIRVLVNMFVLILLGASAYAVVMVVQRSTESETSPSWWKRNEITVVMSSISLIFPVFFEVLGLFERYHPRKQLRMQLARIMVMNLLNLYSLIFALFVKIEDMTSQLESMRPNTTIAPSSTFYTQPTDILSVTNNVNGCIEIIRDCNDTGFETTFMPTTNAMTAVFATYITTKLYNNQNNDNRLKRNTLKNDDLLENENNIIRSIGNDKINYNDNFYYNNDEEILKSLDFEELNANWEEEGNKKMRKKKEKERRIKRNYKEKSINQKNVKEGKDLERKQDGKLFESITETNTIKNTRKFNEELSKKIYAANKFKRNVNHENHTQYIVENSTGALVTENITDFANEDISTDNIIAESISTTNIYTEDISTSNTISEDTFDNTVSDTISSSNPTSDIEYFSTTDNLLSESTTEIFETDTSTNVPLFKSTDFPSTNTITDNEYENEYEDEYENEYDEDGDEYDNEEQKGIEEKEETINVETTSKLTIQTSEANQKISDNPTYTPDVTTSSPFSSSTETITPGMAIPVPPSEFPPILCTNVKCRKPPDVIIETATPVMSVTNNPFEVVKDRRKLDKLCWETMFGQELVKLTVMDLVFTILSTLSVDFFRAVFVRVMNNCWCWDLEKQFPQYGDFKIAENILHLVNNQGLVWMGMFFSPGITLLNLIKLAIIMYLRSWAVLTCNVPHEVVFRASRSNNFYLALLLTMLFLCVLPVGYAIVWVKPSWHCGPFSDYSRIFHIFTQSLRKAIPKRLHMAMDYIASPGIVIPLLVLLVLVIYYMISLTNSLREANNDLKLQLRRERTEERRKMFQIADRRRRGGSADSGDDNTPFGKWKKLLPMLPAKSIDGDIPSKDSEEVVVNKETIKKDFLTKLLRKVKKSPQPDEENVLPPQEEGTDTEHHESLPDDSKDSQTAKSTPKPISAKTTPSDTDSYYIKEQKKSVRTKIITRRDTIENRKEEIRRSSTKSTSSRDLRQDSLSSNWSDNIPVITVTKTESSECILEHETVPNKKKMVHQERIDFEPNKDEDSNLQIAEPQWPSSSSNETLVTIKMEESDYEINIDLSDHTDDTVKYLDEKDNNQKYSKEDTIKRSKHKGVESVDRTSKMLDDKTYDSIKYFDDKNDEVEDPIVKELQETAKILEKMKKQKLADKEKSVDLSKSGTDSSHTSQNKTESSGDYQE